MTKGPLLQQLWDDLPSDRQQHIQARANELEAHYLTLRALRRRAGLTQARVSETLNMPQSNISRLEQNTDMLISTLRHYVEAVGGKLELTVALPNEPPIVIAGLQELIEDAAPSRE